MTAKMTRREAHALLKSLLSAQGLRDDEAALSFQFIRGRFEAGAAKGFWSGASPDQDAESPRKRCYLVLYYAASGDGDRFFLTGIPLGTDGKRLVPDLAVMSTYVATGHVEIEGDRFVLSQAGLELIEPMLATVERAEPVELPTDD